MAETIFIDWRTAGPVTTGVCPTGAHVVVRPYRRLAGEQDRRAHRRVRALIAGYSSRFHFFTRCGSCFHDRYNGRRADIPSFLSICPTVASETSLAKAFLIKSLIRARVHNAIPELYVRGSFSLILV
jgi:hypothetical protein